MKKILVTIAALALSLGAFAQINFGVKVGGNLASISGMTTEDNSLDLGDLAKVTPSQSMKLGLNAGVWAEYMVMPMLGVQVELNYSMQGVNTKLESSSSLLGAASTAETFYHANYINVPILAKLHLGRIRAFVGPQLGFVADFDYSMTSTSDGKVTKYEPEDVEDYNSFDLSLVLGAQYKITPNIGVDARYNLGLTNVFQAVESNKGEVITEAWGKQGVVQVGVFYEF